MRKGEKAVYQHFLLFFSQEASSLRVVKKSTLCGKKPNSTIVLPQDRSPDKNIKWNARSLQPHFLVVINNIEDW